MKPRGIGRGRLIIAIGALLIAIGCFLPWWSVGGTVTALHTGNAFVSAEGLDAVSGIIVFAAALLLLAVMVLPYASRDHYSTLDRLGVYLVGLVVAVGAFGWRLYQIAAPHFAGLGGPQQIPGAWLTGAGLLVVALGVIELFGERSGQA